MYRKLPIFLGALALALFVSAPVLAGQKAAKADTHDGKVVSVTKSKLVMTGTDGKKHSHTVAADAKISCDGTACKLEDLKAGLRIRVTTKNGNRDVAIRVEALNKNERFAGTANSGTGNSGTAHYGKVVSVTGNNLIMAGKNGKEHSHKVAVGTKVSCDGTACKLADLQRGWRIRVTTRDNDSAVVTQIEALNRNEKFQPRN
jgi:hypothetical protein